MVSVSVHFGGRWREERNPCLIFSAGNRGGRPRDEEIPNSHRLSTSGGKPMSIWRESTPQDCLPQITCQFTTSRRWLKAIQLKAIGHVNGTLAPVRTELRSVGIHTEGTRALPGPNVPPKQFAFPAS